MKPTQQRIAPAFRDRHARRDIFRKPRHIGSRERAAFAHTIGTHGMTNRALGRDVNDVRAYLLDAARNLAPAWQRTAQVRISRNWKGGKALRRQERNRRAETTQALRERPQCAHDSVDLRLPSIGCDQKVHQDRDIHRGGATAWRRQQSSATGATQLLSRCDESRSTMNATSTSQSYDSDVGDERERNG